MRIQTVEGIVIKRKNVGETDKLITIFTKQLGKLQLKAKGVRKITSKRASHIELLNHCLFTVYRHQGTPVLTEIMALHTFSTLKENLAHIGFAYHLCELTDRLCPEGQENEDVFHLLQNTLLVLPKTKNLTTLMNTFGKQLLAMLGYGYEDDQFSNQPISHLIESIIENKLKARQILPKLLYAK